MKSDLIPSIAVLVGTIVGAGFLGIPYAVSKSGFLIGGIHIILLGFIMLMTNLYLGELSLRTKGNHQLTGYAEKYLGKTGKTVMFITLAFMVLSALLAYALGVSQSISYLIFHDSSFQFYIAIAFLITMSIITFFGLATFKKGETAGLFLMGALLIGIIVMFAPKIKLENLLNITPSYAFAPFGIILFAYLSLTALPELEIILEKQKKKMKKAIIIGSLIPITGYLLFTLVVVGFKGSAVPEVATLSLGTIFILLGIIAMATSYIALAFVLKSALHYDYNFSRLGSWLAVTSAAFILFFIAVKMNFTFSAVLEIAGTLAGTITGIMTLLMISKAKKKSERKPEYSVPLNKWIIIIISLIFLTGTLLALTH